MKPNNRPAVSVILPVFNGEKSLEKTVRSVLWQSFRNFELIVVDDGSTDNTPSLIERFKDRDNRVRAIRQDNHGITQSLNTGISFALGTYIARIDCGDCCRSDRLSVQHSFMAGNPKIVAAGSYALRKTPEGWPIDIYRPPLGHQQIDHQHINGFSGGILHPAAIIRKESIDKIGGYCEDFQTAQDYDLWLRLGEIGLLGNLPQCLIVYGESLKGISAVSREEQNKMANEAVKRARIRRGLPPLLSYPERWLPKGEKEIVLQWIRRAIVAGNYTTARRYAFRHLFLNPSFEVFRLFGFSFKKEVGF